MWRRYTQTEGAPFAAVEASAAIWANLVVYQDPGASKEQVAHWQCLQSSEALRIESDYPALTS